MKKNLKKLISAILCIAMLSSVACVAAFAANSEYCPSVIIPGIFQSDVNIYGEDGKILKNSDGVEYANPFFLDSTTDMVVAAIRDALIPISALLVTQEDKDNFAANAIAQTGGRLVFGKVLGRDENGDPLYDVRATKYGSTASCNEADKRYIFNQIPLQQYAQIAGEENLYFFSYFSFDNIKALARELYEYIQRVKAETGADKVNIVPISQGGTLSNALLEMYPEVINDLNRIVYIVPALDGANLVGDLFLNGLIDDDNSLYLELFPKLMGEDQAWLAYLINMIIRIMPNADLNNILDIVVDSLINDYLKYTTCLWALVPSGYYEACADKFLSGEEDAELRAQTDWYYQAQLNSHANILKAVEAGVEVFDIVDYNSEIYALVDSWDDTNGDGIIHLESTSMGATSLGVEKQLPADYVSVNSRCANSAHNHMDPRRIVDASTGLLPESTFYFYNQNHERTAANDVIIKLATQLLVDESFVSVHSYPDKFPQFNECRITKGLMNDVNSMKSYDTSALSAEDAAELRAAIAAVDEQLNNTYVTEESNKQLDAAAERYYAIRNKVMNIQPEKEPTKAESAIKVFFTNILDFFSRLFYKLFGGLGFSEIIRLK